MPIGKKYNLVNFENKLSSEYIAMYSGHFDKIPSLSGTYLDTETFTIMCYPLSCDIVNTWLRTPLPTVTTLNYCRVKISSHIVSTGKYKLKILTLIDTDKITTNVSQTSLSVNRLYLFFLTGVGVDFLEELYQTVLTYLMRQHCLEMN